MTNLAIHCSCGQVFSDVEAARDHIDTAGRRNPDAHQVINEVAPGTSDFTDIDRARIDELRRQRAESEHCAVCGHLDGGLRHATEARMAPLGRVHLSDAHEFIPAGNVTELVAKTFTLPDQAPDPAARQAIPTIQSIPEPAVSRPDPSGFAGSMVAVRRLRVADLMQEIVAAKTEILRERAAMEAATIALEAARGRYEAARGRLENADRELEGLLREALS